MNLQEAINIRNLERVNLIGTPFIDILPDFIIRDIVVANEATVVNVFNRMWTDKITNEESILFEDIHDNDYDVYVISHQWIYGSGDLHFYPIETYKKSKGL